MGVQIFLMAGGANRASTLDVDALNGCSVIYEFDDMDGPRRSDVYDWGGKFMERSTGDFDGVVCVRLDRPDLDRLFHDIACTMGDDDWEGYNDRDKANRLAKDQAGLDAARAYLDSDPSRSIYLYGAA